MQFVVSKRGKLDAMISRSTVSIPQAVSTIAILEARKLRRQRGLSFNTASGKYYCNITEEMQPVIDDMLGFNTASGKYYCNVPTMTEEEYNDFVSFQYRKR